MEKQPNEISKIFISQPMKDRSEEEIRTEREELILIATQQYGAIEVIPSFFGEEFDASKSKNPAVKYLGKSIEMLAEADIALFGKGWENARGCKMEHDICCSYGIPTHELR